MIRHIFGNWVHNIRSGSFPKRNRDTKFEKKMYFSFIIRIRFTRLYITLQLLYKKEKKKKGNYIEK